MLEVMLVVIYFFFVDEQTGFIVGIQGSILRSDDGGKNWKKLRNPRSIFIKDRSFRTICFKNKLEGLVGGEGGILWKTNDGGENWTILEGIPNVSYLDIFYDGIVFSEPCRGATLMNSGQVDERSVATKMLRV